MTAGDRYRHRASGRVVELVEPTTTTNGVRVSADSPAWRCRNVATGRMVGIQEHTLSRAWEPVEHGAVSANADNSTLTLRKRLFAPMTTRQELLDYLGVCEMTGDTGTGYRIACDYMELLRVLAASVATDDRPKVAR